MKRVQRVNGSLAQVWGRPQCGFHISAPNVLPAENITGLMCLRKKALCRESNEESPESQWLFGAVWGGRSAASTFQPQRSPRGKHGKANMIAQKRIYISPLTPFSVSPRSLVLRRDRHKETHNPEVNPQSPITAQRRENARMAIPTLAEQERNISQAVLFGAVRQTAGVIERKTFQ